MPTSIHPHTPNTNVLMPPPLQPPSSSTPLSPSSFLPPPPGDDGRRLVLEDGSGVLPLEVEGADTTAGFFTGGWVRGGRGEWGGKGGGHVVYMCRGDVCVCWEGGGQGLDP